MNLGMLYFNGAGVALDHAEAAKWYRRAAESGSIEAQNLLGDMLLDGQGVAQDVDEATGASGELWDRWKRGESLKAIGRAFGKQSSSIYFLVAPHGAFVPPSGAAPGWH